MTGSWSIGGNLNTKSGYHAGFGTQNASMKAAGYNLGGDLNITEEYNGSTWSTKSNTNNAETRSGCGTTSAGNIFGEGYYACELWDGFSWSLDANLNELHTEPGGAGTQNSAYCIGSYSSGIKTEYYNGTSWSYSSNLNTGRGKASASGDYTTAIYAGGYDTDIAEEWNGTSWSYISNLLETLYEHGATDQNNNQTMVVGGNNAGGTYNKTQTYDGNNWNWEGNLNAGRVAVNGGGSGSQTAGLVFGGALSGDYLISTEEYTSGYNLTGTVSDIFNNYIQGAIVSVDNLSDDTDANGNYSITGITAGQYNITTTHSNYFPDIYNTSIPPTSSYNPVLWPLPLQSKDLLTINNPLEANEESNIDISITKNFNNSIVSQINKKTEIVYNYVDLTLNESAKEMYYDYIGYKIKTLSVPALNQSVPNVFIIDYSTEKMKSNTSYWISKLSFLKT